MLCFPRLGRFSHRRLISARPAVTAVVQEGVSAKNKITRFYNPNGAVLDKPTELYAYVVIDPSHVATDVQFRVREHICFHESPDVVPTQGVIAADHRVAADHRGRPWRTS